MDPQIILNTLNALEDNILATVMAQLLQNKPELAPGLVNLAVPDLTYAPTKAFTERRCNGTIKTLNHEIGMGFIDCPELNHVFGCDVVVNPAQVGTFLEGAEVNFAVTLNDDNKPQAFDLLEAEEPSMPSMAGMGPLGGCNLEHAGLGLMAAMMAGAMGMTPPGPTGPPSGCGGGVAPPAGGGGGGGGGGRDTANQEVLGEFYGIIKSYNPEKGFGFIVCDALKGQHDGDVYLHNRHVQDFKVGQEVKFQAYLHNGRLQGRELQDATGLVGPQSGFVVGGKGGGGGGGGGGAAPGASDESELGVFVGKIKNYHQDKGFGFIVCEALNMQGYQGDVFLHQKFKANFQQGDDVAFMAVLRNGKLQARDLQAAKEVLGEGMPAMSGGGGGGGSEASMGGAMDGSIGGMIGGGMGGPDQKRMKMF